MRTLAFVNLDEGVGRPVLKLELGAAMARTGLRVLVVALDPHGHLTGTDGLAEAYYGEGINLCEMLTGAGPGNGSEN